MSKISFCLVLILTLASYAQAATSSVPKSATATVNHTCPNGGSYDTTNSQCVSYVAPTVTAQCPPPSGGETWTAFNGKCYSCPAGEALIGAMTGMSGAPCCAITVPYRMDQCAGKATSGGAAKTTTSCSQGVLDTSNNQCEIFTAANVTYTCPNLTYSYVGFINNVPTCYSCPTGEVLETLSPASGQPNEKGTAVDTGGKVIACVAGPACGGKGQPKCQAPDQP